MNLGGWITLIVSVGSVTALFSWCVYKVLTTSGEAERMHGFEIETPDEERPNQRQR
ncbi:MAG: hypothetical protein ACLFR7_04480 [Opitutales bacterium]